MRMFQHKCNRDFNRDYFQCNRIRLYLVILCIRIVIEQVASNRVRNRLHLWCNCPLSGPNFSFAKLIWLAWSSQLLDGFGLGLKNFTLWPPTSLSFCFLANMSATKALHRWKTWRSIVAWETKVVRSVQQGR